MIFICIIISVYITFYLHDKAVLNQFAYVTALKVSELNTDREDIIKAKVKEYESELLKNKVLAINNLSSSITVKDSQITLIYDGYISIPFENMITFLYHKSELKITVSKKVYITKPVSFIRRMKKVYEIMN